MLVQYQQVTLKVFAQLVIGRLRLYCGALPDHHDQVVERWKKGKLGKHYVIRPIANQAIGEEVLLHGNLIAVFGFALTNAHFPEVHRFQEYRERLNSILSKL